MLEGSINMLAEKFFSFLAKIVFVEMVEHLEMGRAS
jgi:hypothetical protein